MEAPARAGGAHVPPPPPQRASPLDAPLPARTQRLSRRKRKRRRRRRGCGCGCGRVAGAGLTAGGGRGGPAAQWLDGGRPCLARIARLGARGRLGGRTAAPLRLPPPHEHVEVLPEALLVQGGAALLAACARAVGPAPRHTRPHAAGRPRAARCQVVYVLAVRSGGGGGGGGGGRGRGRA